MARRDGRWFVAVARLVRRRRVDVVVLAGGLLVLSRRLHPLFPGVLLIVTAAAVWGEVGHYDAPKLGTFHAGIPPLTTHLPLRDLPHLVAPALVIALLGFAEASSIARRYAALDRTRWDANREFVSQGAANIAAGMFGGFPVGASFSRSALNRLAGARSSASALVTGLAVLAFLPLGFLLAPLPRAVLAITVIVAIVPLMRLTEVVEIVRLSRPQATITLTAFVLTLAFAPHIERAILIAIGVSVAIHLWRELRLDIEVDRHSQCLEASPHGVLWFGNARVLEDRVVDLLARNPDATELAIRLDGLGRIDLAGAFALRTLLGDARQAGLTVSVLGAPQHATRVLGRVLGNMPPKRPS
ncbi:MAG: SulP family inorganic anion transporter [Actinobacteria bacterium]|nr:SulP family inorganic anion transporter [Actinomycetota bacterium]